MPSQSEGVLGGGQRHWRKRRGGEGSPVQPKKEKKNGLKKCREGERSKTAEKEMGVKIALNREREDEQTDLLIREAGQQGAE